MEANNNIKSSQNDLLNEKFLDDIRSVFYDDAPVEIVADEHLTFQPYETIFNPLIKAMGRYLVEKYKEAHPRASLTQRQNILAATNDINKILANDPNKNQFSNFLVDNTRHLTPRFTVALQYAHENMTGAFINRTIENQLDAIFNYNNPYLNEGDNLLNAKIQSGLQRTFKDIDNLEKLSELLENIHQEPEPLNQPLITPIITKTVNVNTLQATAPSTAPAVNPVVTSTQKSQAQIAKTKNNQNNMDFLYSNITSAHSMILVQLETYKFFQKIRGDLIIISKCYDAAFHVKGHYNIDSDYDIEIDSATYNYLTYEPTNKTGKKTGSPLKNMLVNGHILKATVKEINRVKLEFNQEAYKNNQIADTTTVVGWYNKFKAEFASEVSTQNESVISTNTNESVYTYLFCPAPASKATKVKVGNGKDCLDNLLKIEKSLSKVQLLIRLAAVNAVLENIAIRLNMAVSSKSSNTKYGVNQAPAPKAKVTAQKQTTSNLPTKYNTKLDPDKSIVDLWEQYDKTVNDYQEFFYKELVAKGEKDIGIKAIFEEGIISVSGGDLLYEAFTASHQINEGARISSYIRSQAYSYRKNELAEIKAVIEREMGKKKGNQPGNYFSGLTGDQINLLNSTPLIDKGQPLEKQIMQVKKNTNIKKDEAQSVITAIDAAGKMMTDKMQEENTRMQDATQMRNVAGESLGKFVQKVFEICKVVLQ